ncbi:leucine zipper transcription factor-like protein 1 [Ornithodoros turicata]|uniref:leucine zipper transcription factor-like protein 1 n=1 Tax=Ornithodoros turicata TaxID=34597 RepID=UPI0031396067
MASHLEISDEHQDVALSYLKFAKFQRSQRLKVVARCFDDLKESRLMEETYTADEVRDILNALCSVLTAEMESELINSAHTNVLLLQQLFKQAEQWHLKLHVDVSELEDGNAIEQVRYFEDSISPSKGETIQSFQTSKSNKLDPLEDNQGPVGLLKKYSTYNIPQCSTGNLLQSLRKSSETQKHLEKGLTLTKQKLLEVQAQLDLAEKELEKKFSQTTAYNNMKKMLVAKNDQIKELRNALAVYKEGEN